MTESDDTPSLESSAAAARSQTGGLAADGLKRRRLLRLGASGASVALTLTSRPARAWHCNSTSAWGSAQLAPKNASTAARNTGNQITDECWSITEWCGNTAHGSLGQPWPHLGCNTSTQINAYTVGTLYTPFGGASGTPVGLSSSDKVMDKLKNGTQFQKYMLCARLNSKFVSSVQTCLTNNLKDQLALMAGGTYSPPNLPGVVWNQTDIINYLGSNYMVQP
jgi:hypothetical protein